jgi:hypothetical protein
MSSKSGPTKIAAICNVETPIMAQINQMNLF